LSIRVPRFKKSTRFVHYAEKSAASAQLNYQTRLGRYRAGVGSLNELLQAQRSLNTMRIAPWLTPPANGIRQRCNCCSASARLFLPNRGGD